MGGLSIWFVEMGRLFADCITVMLPLVVQAAPVRLKVAVPGIQSTDSLGFVGQTGNRYL
ncbi:hypothetical protein SAMN04488579_10517 [Eubacterium barkeri]|uniref:Uncharacterized protein n=1 Tax=Eubacterium barkeri TaxID=1528 RepID=A0A1H3DKF8_EUBBA|nr:hypothetical protein SAMN04488579_10517 [Eubacterium barkeri]